MEDKRYQDFAEDKLNLKFKNLDYLISAFTHRSYLNEHRQIKLDHNERLEFLGDAVLELVVTEFLYTTYSEPEGILTNWRSSLVRTESIAAAAHKLGFEEYLRLSKGEARGTDRARTQILANSFEAVIGAIYLDQGYDKSRKFIEDNIISTFDEILKTGAWLDPKSRLQELAQSNETQTPQYRILKEEGPDHDKTFKVGVYVNGELRGDGDGPSKQEAQQQAAQQALKFYEKSK
ncbi:MAG: ribonuclease III [bacterium]|jgi:ribonuclease III|nr:ribonuclease III [bacterium]